MTYISIILTLTAYAAQRMAAQAPFLFVQYTRRRLSQILSCLPPTKHSRRRRSSVRAASIVLLLVYFCLHIILFSVMAEAYTMDPSQQTVYVAVQQPQTVYYVESTSTPQQVIYQIQSPPPQLSHHHKSKQIVVPPGTYLPGTPLVVGSHNVVIERYLSEGRC